MTPSGPHGGQGPLVQMRGVSKVFESPAGTFTALRNIDVDFGSGEFVSIVGKSGSGKSTLINMITGIDRPTQGKIRVGDIQLGAMSESRMAVWRGTNLGIVFQFYQLLPVLSLLENILLPMDICQVIPAEERESRAMALLDQVGLVAEAHKMPNAVSGGQQQLAAVARALANRPPIIVADEPTGNLDSQAAETVFRVFQELKENDITILMVTHDEELARRADRTLLLADGEIIHELVASTMPMLSHQQMLKATKSLTPHRFAPGEPILRQGELVDRLLFVTEGEVEVFLPDKHGTGKPVVRLGPGDHLSAFGLSPAERALTSARAALQTSVQVLALGKTVFEELLSETDSLHSSLESLTSGWLHQRRQAAPALG